MEDTCTCAVARRHTSTRSTRPLELELVAGLLIGEAVSALVFLRGQGSCAGNFSFYSISEGLYTKAPKGISSISAAIDFLYTH